MEYCFSTLEASGLTLGPARCVALSKLPNVSGPGFTRGFSSGSISFIFWLPFASSITFYCSMLKYKSYFLALCLHLFIF